MSIRPTDDELQAYIDGQLDPGLCLRVEAYLEENPDAAASVMEALRFGSEIRVWLGAAADPVSPRTERLRRRLGAAVGFREMLPRARRALSLAAVLVASLLGGFLLTPLGADPAEAPQDVLADDAAQAWRVVQLALPPAQSEPVETRVGERLPDQARSEDVRTLRTHEMPWVGGTAVVTLLTRADGEEILLLRAFVTLDDSAPPKIERIDGINTVTWRDDDEAFALSGDVPAGELLALAQHMISRS